MNNIETPKFDKFIHNVRNRLNSITLHAELGKMLIEKDASTEQIKSVFIVILEQCISCEAILSEMRSKTNDSTTD